MVEIAPKQRGLEYEREVEIPVAYEGQVVTTRRVDFVIWDEKDQLLLETKARSELLPEDTEQCLLYLYQGRYRVCLLADFGEKPLGPRGMAPWRGAPRPHWGRGVWRHGEVLRGPTGQEALRPYPAGRALFLSHDCRWRAPRWRGFPRCEAPGWRDSELGG